MRRSWGSRRSGPTLVVALSSVAVLLAQVWTHVLLLATALGSTGSGARTPGSRLVLAGLVATAVVSGAGCLTAAVLLGRQDLRAPRRRLLATVPALIPGLLTTGFAVAAGARLWAWATDAAAFAIGAGLGVAVGAWLAPVTGPSDTGADGRWVEQAEQPKQTEQPNASVTPAAPTWAWPRR